MDDDLESQLATMTLARRRSVVDKAQPVWFKEFYLHQIFKLAHPILLRSAYEGITRAVTSDRALLPTSAIEYGPPALSSSSAELPNREADGQNSHQRHRIDDDFDEIGEAVRTRWRRQRRRTLPNPREQEHSRRKEVIEKFLDPLLPLQDSLLDTFILICWRKSDLCHIRSVILQDEDGDAAIWSAVQHAWFVSRSTLKRYLGRFLKVKTVEIVTVSLHTRVPWSSHSGPLTASIGINSMEATSTAQGKTPRCTSGRKILTC